MLCMAIIVSIFIDRLCKKYLYLQACIICNTKFEKNEASKITKIAIGIAVLHGRKLQTGNGTQNMFYSMATGMLY